MAEIPYIRIGTSYFKFVDVPLNSKDVNRIIIPWNKATIKEDHGMGVFTDIKKYDSYCTVADNIKYERIHGKEGKYANGSYNIYEPICHEPKAGKYEKTLEFLKHIFGEQLDLGLDYLTIIYKHPTQILPILCLVSQERKTGKSTFLNWLKLIYGANMTINTDEDFRNQFNSGWSSKLIIGGEEISLNKKEDIEKLKNLSTSRTIKSEAKNKDKIECQFFGKFILCSNDEDNFIKIDPDEIRFWIRKIPPITKEIPDFDKDFLSKEIPAFLHFLWKREITYPRLTRMWFTREQLYTDALQKVINGSTNRLEREIKEVIIDELITYNLDHINFTLKDVAVKLQLNGVKATPTEIKDIFSKWRMTHPTKPDRYDIYSTNSFTGLISKESKTGRFYNFKKCDFLKQL